MGGLILFCFLSEILTSLRLLSGKMEEGRITKLLPQLKIKGIFPTFFTKRLSTGILGARDTSGTSHQGSGLGVSLGPVRALLADIYATLTRKSMPGPQLPYFKMEIKTIYSKGCL